MSNYEVITLFTGYSQIINDVFTANCTCTLLKSPENNIIIDTLTSWDGDKLIEALKQQNITPEDINYVICTHGHSDHIGCNYLFKNALHIVGKNCISKETIYYEYDFTKSYDIDDYCKVIATPGHTSECVSVLVETTKGSIAIVGDLFEKQEDLLDDTLWKSCSEFPDIQEESRKKILSIADYIIPGHGCMFKTNKNN